MTILEKMYESNLFNPATTDDMGEDFHNAMNRIINAENELLNSVSSKSQPSKFTDNSICNYQYETA